MNNIAVAFIISAMLYIGYLTMSINTLQDTVKNTQYKLSMSLANEENLNKAITTQNEAIEAYRADIERIKSYRPTPKKVILEKIVYRDINSIGECDAIKKFLDAISVVD